MIDLHYWPTPNGHKVTIACEEMGLAYEIKPVNIGRGDQFEPDFLKIAPNNRMPAIIDTDPIGGGAPLSIFESGAIMMYLAEKAGKFWPQEAHAKYEVAQWCYWQTGNQGPKMGEQGNFARAAQDPKNGDLILSEAPSDLREIFAAFDRVCVPEGFLSSPNRHQEPSQERGENFLKLPESAQD